MTFEQSLPLLMFAALAVLLFSGYPVAWVLGGIGLSFAFIAIWVDPFLFDWPQFGAIPSRIFGAIAENLILTAIPMFIFMGTSWSDPAWRATCSIACRCCCAGCRADWRSL
jgi:TRAP-type mannitol/chloroaromatic compound transport system permease large subunit